MNTKKNAGPWYTKESAGAPPHRAGKGGQVTYFISYRAMRDNPIPAHLINFGFEEIFKDLRARGATIRLWHDYVNQRVVLESNVKPRDYPLSSIQWEEEAQ